MPRVKRMASSTIDQILNTTVLEGVTLNEKGHAYLREFAHAIAEEVLARVKGAPGVPAVVDEVIQPAPALSIDQEREVFEQFETRETTRFDNGDYHAFQVQGAWKAWLARAQLSVVPKGWKLVPVVPTAEMLVAALPAGSELSAEAQLKEDASRLYQTLLAASPATLTPVESLADVRDSRRYRWIRSKKLHITTPRILFISRASANSFFGPAEYFEEQADIEIDKEMALYSEIVEAA